MYILGTELNNRYDIRGNFASNRQKKYVSIHDSWHKTFRLSYWLGSRYYGQERDGISEKNLEGELKQNDIDYYFFWGKTDVIPEFLSSYREVTNGEIPGLKIYSLKEKKNRPRQ